MGLINCSECQNPISEKAAICPECGNPISPVKQSISMEDIIKAAPLLYGFLVACGALYLSIYYSPFSFDIFRCVDVSEILVSFINVIQSTLLFFGFIVCIAPVSQLATRIGNSLSLKYPKLFKKTEEEASITANKSGVWEKIHPWWVAFSAVFTFFFVLVASRNDMAYFRTHTGEGDGWLISCMTFCIISFFYVIGEYGAGRNNSKRNIALVIMMAFVVTTSFWAIQDVKGRVNSLTTGKAMVIFKNNDTICTGANNFYIGRTYRYIFFSDSTGANISMIPQDEIKAIDFQQ